MGSQNVLITNTDHLLQTGYWLTDLWITFIFNTYHVHLHTPILSLMDSQDVLITNTDHLLLMVNDWLTCE